MRKTLKEQIELGWIEVSFWGRKKRNFRKMIDHPDGREILLKSLNSAKETLKSKVKNGEIKVTFAIED